MADGIGGCWVDCTGGGGGCEDGGEEGEGGWFCWLCRSPGGVDRWGVELGIDVNLDSNAGIEILDGERQTALAEQEGWVEEETHCAMTGQIGVLAGELGGSWVLYWNLFLWASRLDGLAGFELGIWLK